MPQQYINETEQAEQTLPPDAATADDQRNPRRRAAAAPNQLGTIVFPEPRHDFQHLVLHTETRDEILAGIRSIQLRPELERIWNISAIQPQNGRCIMNFYGPPGTGKTRAALAIAHRLGQPLYQVDYAAVISKYLGDTAKHIQTAFRQAAEAEAILFFDEADSLLSKRVDMDNSCATSINQNRNVLMQELDRFNGIVIVTTNLFRHYDEAIIRRIARHIRFDLPDKSMRKSLFANHLPASPRIQADLAQAAVISNGLSGGDILNACVNALHAASAHPDPDQWHLTTPILNAEIQKILSAKNEHVATPTSPAYN